MIKFSEHAEILDLRSCLSREILAKPQCLADGMPTGGHGSVARSHAKLLRHGRSRPVAIWLPIGRYDRQLSRHVDRVGCQNTANWRAVLAKL